MTRSTALLTAIAASLVIVACGGSGGGSGSGGTATNGALAVTFAKCIRAHGVPEYPDPGSRQDVEQSGDTTGGGTATVAGHAILLSQGRTG